MTKRSFWQSLVAILAGNAIYFALQPHLPPLARHQLYQVDAGLAVDFSICLLCYALLRLVR